jgi:cobaltochelatase CobN
MHLPVGDIGRIDDGEAAVDLGLPPADVVFLSAADTELALIARVAAAGSLSVTTVNLGQLEHPLSVDLFVEKTILRSRCVVLRLMGGSLRWRYLIEETRRACRRQGVPLVCAPGDGDWDAGLEDYSTVSPERVRLFWRYLVESGEENAERALALCGHFLGRVAELPPPPVVLPRAGCYRPGRGPVPLDELLSEINGMPVAPIIFYRALLHGQSTAPVDALAEALSARGLFPLPIYVSSLKDEPSEAFIDQVFSLCPPTIVLNATAFAVSRLGAAHAGTVLDRPGRPVLQVVVAGSTWEDWRNSLRGLGPSDLTMNVVLPEVDGRILTRAVSFKERVGTATVYRQIPDRIEFVAEQAARWVRLAETPAGDRKIALVLSNYPERDGRIANGVGLDTPASAVSIAMAMGYAGYDTGAFPPDSAALMEQILAGRTDAGGTSEIALQLSEYRRFFNSLPGSSQAAVTARWGAPERDPAFLRDGFQIAAHRHGNLVVAIQPARGYAIDPKATYHDPDLVPPHGYLAFYAWLRTAFAADAVVHVGKHGNLEWLPGKALGLSETCWPEIALGPTPVVYPFIVNDPGEGAQAKRRSSAVIVDHLMPAMTRAETHGPLAELETLIDEYYLAAGIDPRRRDHLRAEIVALAARHGLDRDLGIAAKAGDDALRMLDGYVCELKEMQIRDGLHTLGAVPSARQRTDTLVAIARTPRAGGRPADASLHRAIAADFGLGFDPLDCDPAAEWRGPRPEALAKVTDAPWRTHGDTTERIELFTATAVGALSSGDNGSARQLGPRTDAVLAWIAEGPAPALDQSGDAEIAAVLAALDGRFVAPGPSGAPTRGRPDVLPTGRNFYSVDIRAVPTAAAWALGRKAADVLALRYFQDEGEWPRAIALSAWGTSNMRTGGDDIAQVLAFIGAEPQWEPGTGRVTGFRVMTLAELGRPRIDVTLKISGMFRDAFPVQIDLIDSAVRAVAVLDENDDANPIAATVRAGAEAMVAEGVAPEVAARVAATRIFGAKPGAYGAGLQALIDTGTWDTRADLAEAVMAWGSFAYGGGQQGDLARRAFARRLQATDAVLHNQDNREHDILDSDDYYQFQGGLAAAVEAAKGAAPRLYHGDHARPETPKIRSLGEEVSRVVRGRAANPKWIAGMMRHGYKGAFEMAATVDYLFAFAATTNAVQSHHFDQLYDAYVADEAVRRFVAEHNAPALAEMAARFREAVDRDLWAPRANSAYDLLSVLAGGRKDAAE